MSSERDAGLLALQQGNNNAAVPLLEAACQQNPGDFDAHLFLGAAYGQAGRQMDAINSITRAVQLQPANAQARYNLAVAMEQGGYREQAVLALGQALTLQPDYPKAQDALRRLQPADTAVPGAAAPGGTAEPAAAGAEAPEYGALQHPGAQGAAAYEAPGGQPPAGTSALPPFGIGQAADPTVYGQQAGAGGLPADAPGYGAPPSPGYGQPVFGTPHPQAPQPGIYGQSTPPNPYAPPAAAPSPYGAPPANPYGAPTPAPYAPPSASPYGAPQRTGPYAPPGAQGAYGQTSPYGEQPRRVQAEDSFDIGQAGKDWLRVITKPAAFFRDRAGSTGMLGPLALMLLYFIPVLVSIVIQGAQAGDSFRRMPGLGPMVASGGIVMYLVFFVPAIIIGVFVSAWVIHLIGLLFGNRSAYSASFRALVYAYAPFPVLQVIIALIPKPNPLEVNPLTWILILAGLVWWLVLLVMAISSEQEIGTGPAVGVVLLSFLGSLILLVGVSFVLGIVLALAFAAAAGSHGWIPLR